MNEFQTELNALKAELSKQREINLKLTQVLDKISRLLQDGELSSKVVNFSNLIKNTNLS